MVEVCGWLFRERYKTANASGAASPIVHLAWQAVENDMKALAVGHTIPITHTSVNSLTIYTIAAF
ncbi:MAG: hypothetical protein ACLPY5_03935 [Candidatus Bathyarchaeia archaeon]